MAAKTPSTVIRMNFGDVNVVKASFTDLDDGDTWTSGITGYIGHFVQDTDNPTTQASVGVAAAHSSGVFTFYPAEDDKTADLYVLVRA